MENSCRLDISGDHTRCECGQVWSTGDVCPPACLDVLAAKLSACAVGQDFLTDATAAEVQIVWADRVNTYGLHATSTPTSHTGLRRASVVLDDAVALHPSDTMGLCVTALASLAVVTGAVLWLIQ